MSVQQRYAVLLSYLGTHFCGWQRQPPGRQGSVQELLEDSLNEITQERAPFTASGRTDAGVHALGQVAHFDLRLKDWDPDKLRKGLNSQLPKSVRVLDCVRVGADFHSTRDAVKKQYSYYYQQGPEPLPHLVTTTRWIRLPLDVAAMNRGLGYLLGEHDFKVFQAAGGVTRTTVRTLYEAEVTVAQVGFPLQDSGASLIRIRVVATGFLKQMVRAMAGTLLEVGEGKQPPEIFAKILETQDRSLLGTTAPGRALWLEKVTYPDSILAWHRVLS